MNIDIWNPALALFVVVGTVVIYLTRNRMRRSNEEQQEEVEANNDEVEGDKIMMMLNQMCHMKILMKMTEIFKRNLLMR